MDDREEPQAAPGRTAWRRHRRPLAVAAGGLAVVTGVLVSTVLSSTGTGGTGGTGSTGGAAGGARHAAAQGQPASATRPGEEPKPEKCEDGENPAASLRPSGDSGDAVERIKDKGKLTVGVDQNSYLWGYRDPTTGDIDGFDIELVRALARDLVGGDGSDKITYKTIPTNERIDAVKNGDVDMVVRTMTITCDRKDDVAFSTAYFEAGQQLLVPKAPKDSERSRATGESGASAGGAGEYRVTGFDKSMRGKRVCYASGSTAETMMKSEHYKALGARPVVVPNQLDCLVRLQLGKADATVTDSALGAGQAAQDPSVELIGEPETVEPYGVAMKRENEDLVRRVNKVLKTFRKTEWKDAYDKWLGDGRMGTDDGKKPAPPKALYRD